MSGLAGSTALLDWLRKLLGLKRKASTSLLEIAREVDSAKTRRVLAKNPAKPPPQVLAQVLTRSLEKIGPSPRKPTSGAKSATNLVEVMQSEASAHARPRPPSHPEAPKPVLAEVLRTAPDVGPRRVVPPVTPPDATPLVQVNAAAEADLSRRSKPATASPAAALPVEQWSRLQQDTAMRGKTAPTAPDNSKLHHALGKEDSILRALAAKSAAKETARRARPPTTNTSPPKK